MTKGVNNTLSPYSSQPLSAILGHYADVIEGGSKWRQADYLSRVGADTNPYTLNYIADMSGVAGYGSPHPYCQSASTPVAGFSTDTVIVWNGPASLGSRPDLAAQPFYLHNTVTGEVRRITAQDYDGANGFEHTVEAFSSAPDDADPLQLLEGFRRVAPGIDIDDEELGLAQGMDRVFTLDVDGMGAELDLRGAGFINYTTEMTLTVRYQRTQNHRVSTAMLFHNANILTRAMEIGSNRDPYHTRSVRLADAPEIETLESFHLVTLTFDLEYRVTPVLREATSRIFGEVDTA